MRITYGVPEKTPFWGPFVLDRLPLIWVPGHFCTNQIPLVSVKRQTGHPQSDMEPASSVQFSLQLPGRFYIILCTVVLLAFVLPLSDIQYSYNETYSKHDSFEFNIGSFTGL